MRIAEVHVWRENLALTRPYTIAYKTVDSVENVFLTITLENGMTGIGAAGPSYMVTGETVDDSAAAIKSVAESVLRGEDIRYFQRLLRQCRQEMADRPAAMAAVDAALHDAFTRFLDIRLIDWLGQVHKALPTSVTIGITSVEETQAQAREHVANGFRIIKLKTGRSVAEDVEVFTKLRETVGPGIKIRIDANQGYQPADLIAFADATRHLDVEFFEQPFPPRQLELQLELPPILRKACAADEDLHHAGHALTLAADPQPYGIFNIKLMKCGGVAEAQRIAMIAERRRLAVMWGCNDESRVSITAALHAALASPATRYLDLDGSLDLARDVVSGGFVIKDGLMYLTDAVGLGVKLL
ncbi:MAG: dipeptide epimerase [Lewinella sp.]|nr:dipeptide epimerase [Lewinella sp.]